LQVSCNHSAILRTTRRDWTSIFSERRFVIRVSIRGTMRSTSRSPNDPGLPPAVHSRTHHVPKSLNPDRRSHRP
jgi:hypothetical protein